MRLICPNCGAQYEVSDDAIPDGGRDVQCSNCGHAWFQLSPDLEAALAEEEDLFDAPPDAGAAATKAALPGFQPEPVPEAIADAEAPAPPQPAAAMPTRALDDSLLAVLREEADREVAARRSEAPRGLETQPDLGLDAGPARLPAAAAAAVAPQPDPVAQRVATLKGVAPEPVRPAARRELLPDIEEINSTLRASSDRRQRGEEALPAAANPGRSGFRSGFLLMLIIAVALAMTYSMAPKIVQQLPGSANALASYVATVDRGRLWLDGVLHQAIGALGGGQATGG